MRAFSVSNKHNARVGTHTGTYYTATHYLDRFYTLQHLDEIHCNTSLARDEYWLVQC